jgi:hypothetical protein
MNTKKSSKARQLAENMGITLNPSQASTVPTAPPRGSSMVGEPDMDVTTPKTVDLTGRYRYQKKALSGIKRKFESRYGNIDEVEDLLVDPSTLGGRDDIIQRMKDDRARRDAERAREQIMNRMASREQDARLQAEQERRERERRDMEAYRERIRNTRDMRNVTPAPAPLSPKDSRSARSYLLRQSRDSGPIPGDKEGKGIRGLLGLGRQEEADALARVFRTRTPFKNVVIKPFGSGNRVLVKASVTPFVNREDSGDIELYFQKQMKVVMFSKVLPPAPKSTPMSRGIFQKTMKTIIDGIPRDWHLAIDPFIRQKALTASRTTGNRNILVGVAVLMQVLRNEAPERLVNAQDFRKAKRDFDRRNEPEDQSAPDKRRDIFGDPRRGHRKSPISDIKGISPEEYAKLSQEEKAEYLRQQGELINRERERQRQEQEFQQSQYAAQAAFGGDFGNFDPSYGETPRSTRNQPRDPQSGLAEPSQYDMPNFSQSQNDFPGMDIGDDPTMGMGGSTTPTPDDLGGRRSEPIRRSELRREQERERAQQTSDWDSAQFPPGDVPFGGGREEPPIGHTGRPNRTRSDMGKREFEDPHAGEPRQGRGGFDPEVQGRAEHSSNLLDTARMYKGQFNTEAPIVQYIKEKLTRSGFGVPQINDLGKNGISLKTRELDILLRRQGSKANLRTVILEVPKFEMSAAEKVFSQLPSIVWPPKASASLTGFKLNHRVDLKSMINYIENVIRNPELLILLQDYLSEWITKMGQRGISTGTLKGKVKRLRERSKTRRPQGESVASIILDALSPIHEQSWYKEHVAVARKIQGWILRHLGGYQVSCAEIHDRFDAEHEEEAVDKAIEILRSNAAIYPMTGGVTSGRDCIYMINMSRLSSALL